MNYLRLTLLALLAALSTATTDPPVCTITTPDPNILGQETKLVTCCAASATSDYTPSRDALIYQSDWMVYRTLHAILIDQCVDVDVVPSNWMTCWQVMLLE